jgi:hypothetical protein
MYLGYSQLSLFFFRRGLAGNGFERLPLAESVPETVGWDHICRQSDKRPTKPFSGPAQKQEKADTKYLIDQQRIEVYVQRRRKSRI